MSDRPMPTDTMASILDLLQLSFRPDPPDVIISAAPQIWLAGQLPAECQLFDISPLIGSGTNAASLSPHPHSQLEQYVLLQLLSAGWPRDQIKLEYRPDSSRLFRFDIALFDPSGSLLAGIEVAGGSRRPLGQIGNGGQHLLEVSGAPRVFVTDGRDYLQFDRTGQTKLTQLPGPDEFGFKPQVQPDQDRVIRVVDVGWLDAAMRQTSRHHVILDPTIPWGISLALASPVHALMPALSHRPARLEMSHVLLAWLSALPGIEAISTITTPSLAWVEPLAWLRRHLMESVGLGAHIELPASTFRPPSSMKSSYFLLGRHRNAAYFDSLAGPGDLVSIKDKPWYQSYSSWLAGQQMERGFTKPAETLVTWSVAQNDPHADATRTRVAQLGEARRLEELCQVFSSHTPASVVQSAAADDPVEVIDARRLRLLSGEHDNRKYVAPSHEVSDRDFLLPGDVLIPRMMTTSFRAIEFAFEGRAVAGSSVIVIRPIAEVDPTYLVEFLNSNTGRSLLESCVAGAGAPQLSLALLRDLPVPILPIDFERSVEEIDKAYGALLAITNDIDSRRSSLFDSSSTDELLQQLNELKRRSVILTETIKLTESFEFQVSQFFPFPIAHGYRLLKGIVDPRQKVHEQLRVAENILAFVASASLALLDNDDRRALAADLRSYWYKGLSPGDWKEIIRRASDRFRSYHDHPLVASIAKLDIAGESKGFGKAVKFLIKSKNDYKHDRGPKVEKEFLRHSAELAECLQSVMTFLTFWTKYPIRKIERIDAPRRALGVEIKCLRLIGDHQGFSQEQVTWHEPLRVGDLHMEISERKWLPLFPFVQMHVCDRCKAEEIYFVDRWNGRDEASIKSFERGHAEESADTASDLQLQLPK